MTRKESSREGVPEDLTLGVSEVHLWRVRVDDPSIDTERLYENVLSENEKERADRLRFAEERRKFIIARGGLRSILSKYLGSEPSDIVFEYNRYGKPALQPYVNPENIKFNLSHSGNLVLYAITKNNEIGVDVEYIREVKRAGKIIERFFSAAERDFYTSLPDRMKKRTFFKMWTGREAYTKAIGAGFSLPLSGHDISLIPGSTPPSHDKDPRPSCSERFVLYEITTDNNYVAALAVEGKDHRIRYLSRGREN